MLSQKTAATAPPAGHGAKPNGASVLFHWLAASLIFLALTAGLYAVYYADGCCGQDRNSAFLLHAYAGLSVLGIVVLRLVFRVFFPWPHAPGRPKFDIGAIVANHVHWVLYIMMVLIPLTGWIVASGMGCCMAVPGLPNVNGFSLGIQGGKSADINAAYRAHVFLVWSIMAWVFAHVAGMTAGMPVAAAPGTVQQSTGLEPKLDQLITKLESLTARIEQLEAGRAN